MMRRRKFYIYEMSYTPVNAFKLIQLKMANYCHRQSLMRIVLIYSTMSLPKKKIYAVFWGRRTVMRMISQLRWQLNRT